jgi:hypothetical protein
MAQDFYAAFGLGKDDKTIATIDLDGVALAGIKALDAKQLEYEAHIEVLESQITALNSSRDQERVRPVTGSVARLPGAISSVVLAIAVLTAALSGWVAHRRASRRRPA